MYGKRRLIFSKSYFTKIKIGDINCHILPESSKNILSWPLMWICINLYELRENDCFVWHILVWADSRKKLNIFKSQGFHINISSLVIFKLRIYKTPLKLLIKAHTIFFSCLLSIFCLKIYKVRKSWKNYQPRHSQNYIKNHQLKIFPHIPNIPPCVEKCHFCPKVPSIWDVLACLSILSNYLTLYLSSTCCPKVYLSTSADQSWSVHSVEIVKLIHLYQ